MSGSGNRHWGIAMAIASSIGPQVPVAVQGEFGGREKLRASSVEFRKDVIEITDGVFAAVGYSASNVVLIRGKDGSIIVDTSANPVDGRAIVEAFGARLVRPVRAIIYTHNHPDHSGGATVFAGSDDPEIYSHQTLVDSAPEFGRGPRGGGDVFGTELLDDQFINAGIQLDYGRVTPHTREGFVPPTKTFSGEERNHRRCGRSDATHSHAGRSHRKMSPSGSPRKASCFRPTTSTNHTPTSRPSEAFACVLPKNGSPAWKR